ncbi:MAG: hypothetical protein ACHQWU_08885 [Gemmatimonadales bacterium]
MPRTRIPLLFAAAVLAMGCSDSRAVTAPSLRKADGPPLEAKTPSLATVSLVVTVSDADSLGNAYRIRSDGLGSYTDGSQNVQAILDQFGTFAFNTDNSSHSAATRWVNYDFTDPVDPTNSYRPNPSTSANFHFSTGPSSFSPFTAIQNLGVNGKPTTECVYMGNGMSNGSLSWAVSFHKGHEDVATSPTAFAFVTRTSVSPAVWTVTPVGSCSPASNVASLRSGDGSVLYGYYNLPFFFTLRAK